MTLEEHKKDRAEQHVGLLTDHAKKLAGAIVRQVKTFYAKKPAKNYFWTSAAVFSDRILKNIKLSR